MSETLRKARKHVRLVITKIEVSCEEEIPFIEQLTEHPETLFTSYSPASIDFPHFTQERESIDKSIQDLKKSFDDPEDRQIFYAKLRTLLVNLRNKVGLDMNSFLRVINMCIDTLDNTKSELINFSQVGALEFVLGQMRERMEEFEANQFQEILFKAGLTPVPKLEGTALLYE